MSLVNSDKTIAKYLIRVEAGPEIVSPAVGFIILAVEAVYQSNDARSEHGGKHPIHNSQYRLRNGISDKALVLKMLKIPRLYSRLLPFPEVETIDTSS